METYKWCECKEDVNVNDMNINDGNIKWCEYKGLWMWVVWI